MEKKIRSFGFSNVREIPVSDIPFEPSLLELCKQNSCGNYGRCYTCPPLVGKPEQMAAKVKQYKKAFVFQKIYLLEDSFDIEGMNKGQNDFQQLAEDVNEWFLAKGRPFLLLTAGGCRLCKTCGAVTGNPCRFPEKAHPSLEACAINVSSLAAACGLKYINGQNTVTYFGMVLFDK